MKILEFPGAASGNRGHRSVTLILTSMLILELTPVMGRLMASLGSLSGGSGSLSVLLVNVALAGGNVLMFIALLGFRRCLYGAAAKKGGLLLLISTVPALISAIIGLIGSGVPVGTQAGQAGFPGWTTLVAALFALVTPLLAAAAYIYLNRAEQFSDRGQLGTGLLVIASVLNALMPLAVIFPLLLGTLFSGADFIALLLGIFGWTQIRKDFPPLRYDS